MRPTKVIIYLIIPDVAVGGVGEGGCWNRSSPKATRVECLRATLKGNRAFLDKDQQEDLVLLLLLLLLLSRFSHVRLCATP